VKVEIAEQPGRQLRIAVINQGATIPAEQLPRLFDRFFRGDSARSDAGSHHGLGLAIVAAIARMHGGRTLARSDGGVTSIGLTLCAAPSTPAADLRTTSGSEVHSGTALGA
jgi:two-component system heavy metal sensor histidine kinase CusS